MDTYCELMDNSPSMGSSPREEVYSKLMNRYQDIELTSSNGSVKKAEEEDDEDEIAAIESRFHVLDQKLEVHDVELKKLEIPYMCLQFEKELGGGAFGQVHLASLWATNVAVKKLRKTLDPKATQTFLRELKLYCTLRHPNVILCLGYSIFKESRLCIVTEYIEHDLHAIIENRELYSLTGIDIILITLGIARGMNYLHSRTPPIVHRDLKPANVLVSLPSCNTKIIDFGISVVVEKKIAALQQCVEGVEDESSSNYYSTSVEYRAPEANVYSSTTQEDVYSFGILYYQLITMQKSPWPGKKPHEIWRRVRRGERPELPTYYPKYAQKMYRDCVHDDPAQRTNFHEIIDVLEANRAAEDAISENNGIEIMERDKKPDELAKRLKNNIKTLIPHDMKNPNLFMYAKVVETIIKTGCSAQVATFQKQIIAEQKKLATEIYGALLCHSIEDLSPSYFFWVYSCVGEQRKQDETLYRMTKDMSLSYNLMVTPVIRKACGVLLAAVPVDLTSRAKIAYVMVMEKRKGSTQELEAILSAEMKPVLSQASGYVGMIVFENHADHSKTHIVQFWENEESLNNTLRSSNIQGNCLTMIGSILSSMPTFSKCELVEPSFIEPQFLDTCLPSPRRGVSRDQ